MSDQGGVARGTGTERRASPDGAHVDSRPFAGDVRGESPPGAAGQEHSRSLVRWGHFAWALLGIAGVLVLGWLLVTRLSVVVIPMLLALFPAALLVPTVDWLDRHRVPRPLATLLVVVAAVAVVGGVFALVVPAFLAQLPALTDSLTSAGNRLQTLAADRGGPLGRRSARAWAA